MTFILSTFYMFGMACSSNADSTPVSIPASTSNTPVATPAPSGDYTSGKKTKGTLPDLKKGLSKEGCDNGPGVMGAASYFVGELNITDSNVRGEEEWVLFANKKWAAHNGGDCTVRWSLTGSKTGTSAC